MQNHSVEHCRLLKKGFFKSNVIHAVSSRLLTIKRNSSVKLPKTVHSSIL